MTTYYVDDGGSATAPYDTWAKAATSITELDIAVSLAAGDIIYVGHDSVDPYVHVSSRTLSLPSSFNDRPVRIISATSGSAPPTYQPSATDQLDADNESYYIDGAAALHGLRLAVNTLYNQTGRDRPLSYDDCTFRIKAYGQFFAPSAGVVHLRNCTVDLLDSATVSYPPFTLYGVRANISDLVITGGSWRTDCVFDANFGTGRIFLNGCDITSFTNGTLCELCNPRGLQDSYLANVKTGATWAPFTSNDVYDSDYVMVVNSGPANDPTYLAVAAAYGRLFSSSSIYRDTGAEINGDPVAWLITTTTGCNEQLPMVTPYMTGVVAAGTKTFDVFITNDTADLNDDEAWLAVEVLDAAGEPQTVLVSDRRVITDTPAAQTDDTASTWNGSGPSFTYKQKLSVTVAVGESGRYQARAFIGKPSISSSSYLYVDPAVTVS